MVQFFHVNYAEMLSFFQIAEALTGLIYHGPRGENPSFQSNPRNFCTREDTQYRQIWYGWGLRPR